MIEAAPLLPPAAAPLPPGAPTAPVYLKDSGAAEIVVAAADVVPALDSSSWNLYTGGCNA